MAMYASEDDCVHRQTVYPNLEWDLKDDFQRRRVASCAEFVQAGDRVLDVGCNSGYFGKFCPQASEVHGVDVNPELVKVAAVRLTSAQVARAEALPFPDHSFDVVNISGVLEQIYDPDSVLKETVRVTRRSVTGNTVYEHGLWGKRHIPNHAWQVRAFSEGELRTLLSRYGDVHHFSMIHRHGEPQCFLFEVRPWL